MNSLVACGLRLHSFIVWSHARLIMSSIRNVAHLLVRVVIFTFLVAIFALPTIAQTINADVVGTVTDTNGAAVQGATVTITKVDTNSTRTVTTGDSRQYEAPLLEI